MKAIVEYPVQLFRKGFKETALREFPLILQEITTSKNEDELRGGMKYLLLENKLTMFYYGFGSSHMWVKQKTPKGKLLEQRIILVEL